MGRGEGEEGVGLERRRAGVKCGSADIVTGNLRIQNCGYYIDRKFCVLRRFSSDVPKSDCILSFFISLS